MRDANSNKFIEIYFHCLEREEMNGNVIKLSVLKQYFNIFSTEFIWKGCQLAINIIINKYIHSLSDR